MGKQGDPRTDPIRSYKWQRLAARVLAEETTCWLCGMPIDFDAPPRTRWSPSVDHVLPRSLGGDPFDRSNLRAAHYGHNSQRGNGTRKGGARIIKNSRRW